MPNKRLQSPGVRRILAGLKAVQDKSGIPIEGRYVEFGADGDRNVVTVGHCPGHPGAEDYQAVFPPTESQKT